MAAGRRDRHWPPVIGYGRLEGIPYIVLEFLEGSHLTKEELGVCLSDIVLMLRLVHQDGAMRAFLKSAGRTFPYQVEALERNYERVRLSFSCARLERAYAQLVAGVGILSAFPAVATHGDVSRKNFILRGSQLFLIDWEGAALADALRDLGPLLWWYAPPSRWKALSELYGPPMTSETTARIYWWAACYSLDITAGLLERGYYEDAREYIEDFLAASASRPNPRPRWRFP